MANLKTTPSKWQDLVTTYTRQPAPVRVLLQLTSVIYESISQKSLNKFLTAFYRHQNQIQPNPPFDTNFLTELINKKLLILSKQAIQCNPIIAEVLTRDAKKEGHFISMVAAVHETRPITIHFGRSLYSNTSQLVRELRISFHSDDYDGMVKKYSEYNRYNKNEFSEFDFLLQVATPFDRDWFRSLPPRLYEKVALVLLTEPLLKLNPWDDIGNGVLEDSQSSTITVSNLVRQKLVELMIFRGDLVQAQLQLQGMDEQRPDHADPSPGWIAFMKGEDERAITQFRSALHCLKKESGKRKVFFQSTAGLFFILALIKEGTPEALKEARDYVQVFTANSPQDGEIYHILSLFIRMKQGEVTLRRQILMVLPNLTEPSYSFLFKCLCIYWIDPETIRASHLDKLSSFALKAHHSGFQLLAREAFDLVEKLKPTGSPPKTMAEHHDIRSLVNLFSPQQAWEQFLDALTQIHPVEPKSTGNNSEQRLVWFINLHTNDYFQIEPREQKITTKGKWTKGRAIALKRLTNPEDFPYLTPQDLEVCRYIKAYSDSRYYSDSIYYSLEPKAIGALVGHPHVFWDDESLVRVEIVKGEPELLVKKKKTDHITLELSHPLNPESDLIVVKETPTRVKVIDIKPEHRRIAEILGDKNCLQVPASAKERILNAISAVSNLVTVHSDIGGGNTTVEAVPADSTPHLHLLPAGEGLKVALLTRPFASAGPYYPPGTGGKTVIAEIDHQRLQTHRDLAEERRRSRAVIAECPTLQNFETKNGEWLIPEPEMCLELLTELQNLGNQVIVEWPQGEKMRVSHRVDFTNFRMSIKRQNDWFLTEGEVRIDEAQVFNMQQLMELLGTAPGRFIPLADGQFLALTDEFRKRMDELRAYSDKSGKGMRIHPLAALAMEDWLDEVGELKSDQHWQAHIRRLKESQSIEPVIPSTLQAELRDYQIAGFQWLARLAHWGVGACLADDMGLGKTLQSLALILTRAPQGPTLIVAPTSVGMNWIAESQRFAPTLNPLQFGSSTSDRQKLLDQLKPFDLLVCSYGLLQQEEVAEKLAKVQWQTIVLDEAQSIKNFATKRSQAAMNLQGDFKLLTTGTPIENHLGELWNLFRFINPGLLGSLEKFNQEFALPIERNQDKVARNRLKKLIQPFLLRRTKNQVLQELPSRTEILLQVELSQEEKAFYEALRREAMNKLNDSDAVAGAKYLQVLTEIMKLRRACCNSRLVNPAINLESAKLQLFGEVLTELLDNNHKALVFSQFVDHLHCIREYLDEKQINYHYLDGSTPANERQKRVNAFQSGEGDVFLISLKAGGTGLNLTAADYVIHMDPWWNPAVEDQASDRAHRIGQQRPVTIYRLVAKDTIEEKIVNMHQSKRDLADSLLEGADVSGKVSTDELLRLIST